MSRTSVTMIGSLGLAAATMLLPQPAQAVTGMDFLVVGETPFNNRWMQQFDAAGRSVSAQAWVMPMLPAGTPCQAAASFVGDRQRFALSCRAPTFQLIQMFVLSGTNWIPDTLPDGSAAQFQLPIGGGETYRGLIAYKDGAVPRFELMQTDGTGAATTYDVINVTLTGGGAQHDPTMPSITQISTGTTALTGVLTNVRLLQSRATLPTGPNDGLMLLANAGPTRVGNLLPKIPVASPGPGFPDYVYDVSGIGAGPTMSPVVNDGLPGRPGAATRPIFDRFTWVDEGAPANAYDCGLYPNAPAPVGSPRPPMMMGCSFPMDIGGLGFGAFTATTLRSIIDPTPNVNPMAAAVNSYTHPTNLAWGQVIPISAPRILHSFASTPANTCDFDPVSPGIDDALLLARLSVGLQVDLLPPATMAQVIAGCDCNTTGAIDILDVLGAARRAAGLPSGLPAC